MTRKQFSLRCFTIFIMFMVSWMRPLLNHKEGVWSNLVKLYDKLDALQILPRSFLLDELVMGEALDFE